MERKGWRESGNVKGGRREDGERDVVERDDRLC